jgi:hypothetical protein
VRFKLVRVPTATILFVRGKAVEPLPHHGVFAKATTNRRGVWPRPCCRGCIPRQLQEPTN